MAVVGNPISVHAFVLISCVNFVLTIANKNFETNQPQNLEQFHFCIKESKKPRLGECIGRTAINFLQRFDEKDNYTIADNLVSMKDEKVSARSLINVLDTDPVDFRGILENAGAVFSQRSFEWHMDNLYPGLMLRIGPTADANSLAEFIVDPAVAERQFSYQEPSTARVLAKQYLVPFLLGLKFNLIALVPLLFAGIALLLKKSLFLAKLAIYVSSFLGFGGVASILGGLSGVGAGLGGGVLGGPGGLLGGGFGIGPHHVRGHGGAQSAFDVAGALGGGQTSYFPGKTTVFNQHYDVGVNSADEHYHAAAAASAGAPYKRSERKVNFDKPRDYIGPRTLTTATSGSATTTTTTTSFNDRFYDYDKQKFIQDRSGKLRSSNNNSNGKLGPSAFDDEADEVKKIFKPSEQLGWKVVDMRV